MPFLGATAGYLAGAQANDAVISYALEAVYGTAPAGAYQKTRFTGENFRKQKTRQRPAEINALAEASQAVTVSEAVSGTLSGVLSAYTYDDLIAGAVDNDFLGAVLTVGTGHTVTFNLADASFASVPTLYAANNDFATWPAAGVLKILNDATSGLAGSWFFVKLSSQDLTIYPVSSTPYPAANATIPAGAILTTTAATNGSTFKSFTVQEKIGGSWLRRTGGYVSKASIALQQGSFATSSFDFSFASQAKSTVDAAGSYLSAPNGPVIEPVKGFGGVYRGSTLLSAKLRGFSLDIDSDGAGQDYAMGQAAAVGQRPGSCMVSGSCQLYFPDYTLYDAFEAEALAPMTFLLRDSTGTGYAISLLNSTLQNPQINAGSKNSPVVATFDIEANPIGLLGGVSLTGGTVAVSKI